MTDSDEEELYLSFDVGIINLAYCVMNNSGKIFQWDIINLADGNNKLLCSQTVASTGKKCTRKAFYKTDESKTGGVCKMHGNNTMTRNITVLNSTELELRFTLFERLQSIVEDFKGIKYILIEKQPNHAREKIKGIAFALLDFFVLRRLDSVLDFDHIQFVDAKNKLTVYTGPPISCHLKTQYARNKWYAQRYCEYILKEDQEDQVTFLSKHKKKDDLSDCFLQGLWYMKYKQTGKEPPISSQHQKLVFKQNNLLKFEKVRARKATKKQLAKQRLTLSSIKHALKFGNVEESCLNTCISFYFGDCSDDTKKLLQDKV